MGLAETFKALSDPVRREILMMLRDGKKTAGEIAAHFQMTGGAAEKFYLLSVEHQRVRGDDAVDCTVFRPKGRGERK